MEKAWLPSVVAAIAILIAAGPGWAQGVRGRTSPPGRSGMAAGNDVQSRGLASVNRSMLPSDDLVLLLDSSRSIEVRHTAGSLQTVQPHGHGQRQAAVVDVVPILASARTRVVGLDPDVSLRRGLTGLASERAMDIDVPSGVDASEGTNRGPSSPIPEPGAALLFGVGTLVVGLRSRKRAR